MGRDLRIARWVCVVLLALASFGVPLLSPVPVAAQDRVITVHFVDQFGNPFPDGTLTFDWGKRPAAILWPTLCVGGYLPVYDSSITYQLLDNMYWYGPCVTGGIGNQTGDFDNVPTHLMPSEYTMVVEVDAPPEPTAIPTDVPAQSPTPEPTDVPAPSPTPEPTATSQPTELPVATEVPTVPPTQSTDEIVQQLVATLIAILSQILASME